MGSACARPCGRPENDELGPRVLTLELVAGHATMLKLSAKVDRWLALVRSPVPATRTAAAARPCAWHRRRRPQRALPVGLAALAKLRGWEGFRKGSAAGRGSEPMISPPPPSSPPPSSATVRPASERTSGGPKGGARAAARRSSSSRPLRGRQPPTATRNRTAPRAPTPAAANRASLRSALRRAGGGKLRHGLPAISSRPRAAARRGRAGCPCPPWPARRRPGRSACTAARARRTAEASLARVRANRRHGARSAE